MKLLVVTALFFVTCRLFFKTVVKYPYEEL